jgi:hypothetical protein
MTNPDAGQRPSAEPDSSASQPTPGGHEAPPIEQSGSFPGPVLDFPSGPVPPAGPYADPYQFGAPPQFAAPGPPASFGPPAPFGPPTPFGPPPQFGPPAAPPPFGPAGPPPQFGSAGPPPQFGPPPFGPPLGIPAPPIQSALYPTAAPTNGMAIGSLVTSLVAIPFSFLCYGIISIPAAIVGIVLGIASLNQLKQRPQKGKEMAIAGIIAGGIALVLSVIMMVVLGVILSHARNHGLSTGEV